MNQKVPFFIIVVLIFDRDYFFKGSGTARYAAKHLHTHILDEFNQILDQKQKQSDDKIIHQKELLRAIRSAFINLDEDLRKNNTDKSGAVCVSISMDYFIYMFTLSL